MKNWLASIIFLSAVTLQAQEINEYEYIIFPESFTDFKKNEYNLKSYLNKYLKDKNYKPLSSYRANWPEEIQKNPCLALRTDIKKVKSFLTNKLNVEFLNCDQKVIYSIEGNSKIKEFEEGYKDALAIAMRTLPFSNPNDEVYLAPRIPEDKPNFNKNEEINFTSEKVSTTPPVEEINKATKLNENKNQFSNESITVDKIDLKDGGFMLMNADNAQVIAKFYPSLKANVYHVILTENNINTIGYTNQNTISYEKPNANNTWKEVKFTSK